MLLHTALACHVRASILFSFFNGRLSAWTTHLLFKLYYPKQDNTNILETPKVTGF